MKSEVWTIVLAAGAGRRLASVTGGTPKQFWSPDGSRSLLEQTLTRIRPLVEPERTVTVIDVSHQRYVDALPSSCPLGEVAHQPMDRGTATGVLLPLMRVLASAPDAVVIITPSDHGVEDADCFRKGLTRAIARVRSGTTDFVLFGVEPSTVSSDFGWITPEAQGAVADAAFDRVASFVEKPPASEAFQLFESGAVWNTMVVVARARALFDRYRRHLSFHADVLTAAHELLPEARDQFLREWYRELPKADFCRDLLTPSARDLCVYTWPAEMGWSDLGTPDRLQEWLSLQERPLTMRLPSTAEQLA
jgi:mannose-1-phosphate guanylyltransferase